MSKKITDLEWEPNIRVGKIVIAKRFSNACKKGNSLQMLENSVTTNFLLPKILDKSIIFNSF